MSENKSAYASRGVSATKDEVHAAIKTQDKGVFPGAFCKLVADPAGDENYCAAFHADGAGTKSALAYIKYKETGSTDAFYGIAQDSAVMNMDDLLCIGAKGGFVMSNTIGRNAHRVGGDAIAAVINGYDGFAEKMAQFGVDITMAGGETADVGDLVGTIICDSTFFVRLARRDVIDCDNIKPGDVIVGLASFGQASYEDKYNAGMGSNGLTAGRHLLLAHKYAELYPETYSATMGIDNAYVGKYDAFDTLPGTDVSVIDAILSPTRTYAPIIADILRSGTDVHGIIHCTGGGQAKCKNFGKNLHYIKDNLFERPPLFEAFAESGAIDAREMYQVFNMGHRMELYLNEKDADAIIATAKKYNVDAKIVGRVEEGNGKNSVTLTDRGQTFEY